MDKNKIIPFLFTTIIPLDIILLIISFLFPKINEDFGLTAIAFVLILVLIAIIFFGGLFIILSGIWHILKSKKDREDLLHGGLSMIKTAIIELTKLVGILLLGCTFLFLIGGIVYFLLGLSITALLVIIIIILLLK